MHSEPSSYPQQHSKKSYTVAVILSAIFGIIGIHHFYVNRFAMGIFDMGMFIATIFFYVNGQFLLAFVFFIVDFIHTVIVTYLLLVGQYKDGSGDLIAFPGQKL